MSQLAVRTGGLTKDALLTKLHEAQVQMNAYAMTFILDEGFIVSTSSYTVDLEILSLADLGLPAGAHYSEVLAVAAAAGLQPCPAELGPHMRLQLLEQLEDRTADTQAERGAPRGSITVASMPLKEDDDFPKGLYLRRLDGCLWLRGYRSWSGHIWRPEDVFAFAHRA
ncbi:hypothetical protein LNV08_00630 [Paucibacter sp. TC2R-5]|uniref:hypothetical protein n=1 Tax=Paucibacter sp. TC2R-5 TaxID=2893555 RepID=UPI0021E36D72|nr:hypothetical protein [Paucibacter sp. TC2R-5]MCV2357473.1 hypothetical protein [Paucibacter sp. TC2R-5]